MSFTMIAYSLAAIIVWFCGSYFGMACDLVLLIICFLTFTLLYAIINNQANIERLMGRRHYSLAMLPVGMRRYNLLLICAGFVLVVLGLLFQKPIWHIVKFGFQVLASFLYIFVLFFRFIIWLLARPAQPDKPLPQVSDLPVFGQAQEAAAYFFYQCAFPMVGIIAHSFAFILYAAADLGSRSKNSFSRLEAAEIPVLPAWQKEAHVHFFSILR